MLYVLAKKNCEFLDTPVFSAGPNGDEDAVAVFTTRAHADRYIEAANWSDEYEGGSLESAQIAQWIASAQNQGADMVVVDPNRDRHLDGQRQNVLFLKELLEAMGDAVVLKIHDMEAVKPN